MESKSPAYSETKQGILLSDSRLFKYIAPALIVCIGIALSVLLLMTTEKMEDARIKAGFEQDAQNRFNSFKNISDNYLMELEAFKAFFAASGKITRADFRVFAKELLSHFNRTQALEWIPRVPDPERAAYEAKARREGFPDFQITERTAQGIIVKADRRKEYFPVYFIEPFKGNETALGHDLASEPLILAALNYARDTEQVTATAGIKPVQEKGGSYSVLILQPVYRKGPPSDSIKAKRKNIDGFMLGAFRLGDLLEEAMSSFAPAGIDIYLFDISANDKENILYFHASRVRAVQTLPVSNFIELTKGLHYSGSFEMAGRKWLALYIPTPDYISSRKTLDAWWFFAGGILVTGLLTGYIRLINNQTAQNRQYTAGLLRAKEELENEIAERKIAENNLQKAEQEIRTIYNSIAGHLTVVDRNFRIVSFNSVVEKQFGSDIKGKLCYEVYQNRKHICPDCGAKITFETGEPAFIFMPATSVSNPFEIHTSPIFDEQGEIVAVVEHGIEVTEKVKALEALKKSEERFKALTESTSDWIWEVDENGIYTYVSPKIKELLGYEPKEVIGKTPFDFMPQEEARRVVEEFGEIVKARRPIIRLENINLHKDGYPVVLETSGVPIFDAKGSFRGYRGIDRNITERKIIEKKLQLASNYNRSLIEASLDPLVTIDVNGKITDVNTATEAVTGYSREELIGTDFSDYFTEPEKAQAGYQKVFKDGMVYDYALELNHRHGHITPVLYNASVYRNETGEIAGVFAAARDITELKKMEDLIRASLEEKEILLREIHHRVKNNMTVIYSLLDLQSKFTSKLHEREILNDAKARIKAMALIHEKLYRSKDMTKIDFSDYLRDILNNMLMSYLKDPGRITLNIDVRDVDLGMDDAIPCGLIINELVSNALKHALPEYRTCEITVGMRSYDKDMIELIVADNGIGLPADLDTRKKASMGLSLVDALVNQLHGKIELHKDEGTKFRITFMSHK
jgi:PAS domain S-box-containing protein